LFACFQNAADQNNFCALGGLLCLSRVLCVIEETSAAPPVIPPK
jgi:hypothetical protein